MSGGISNVLIENLEINQAERGIRIKSRIGRGGVIENILIQNSSITSIKEPLQIDFKYSAGSLKSKTNAKPVLKRIKFYNIDINSNSQKAIEIIGIKDKVFELLFENILFKNKLQVVDIDTISSTEFKNNNNLLYNIKNSHNIKINQLICPTIDPQSTTKPKVTCSEKN